jgi:hypothetical protein
VRAGILLRERRDRFCCPPVAFGGFRFAAELMVSSSTRTALAVGLRVREPRRGALAENEGTGGGRSDGGGIRCRFARARGCVPDWFMENGSSDAPPQFRVS